MLLALFATVYLLVSIIYFGLQKPGYSHIRHTISELGETGAPNERFINLGIFLPTGLIFLAFPQLYHLPGDLTGLCTCLGIGYTIGGLFPCDEGAPLSGSWRQSVHNLGGIVQYVGAIYYLRQIGTLPGLRMLEFAGVGVFAFAVLMSIDTFDLVRGLYQRLAEVLIFGPILYLLILMQLPLI